MRRRTANVVTGVTAVTGLFLGAAAALSVMMVVLAFPAMLIFGAFLGYQGIDGPGFFETLFGLLSLSIVGNTFFPANTRGRK